MVAVEAVQHVPLARIAIADVAQAARSDTWAIAAAGHAMDNHLDGGAGNNVISGQAGIDTLIDGFGDVTSWLAN